MEFTLANYIILDALLMVVWRRRPNEPVVTEVHNTTVETGRNSVISITWFPIWAFKETVGIIPLLNSFLAA